jgi:hypothetical protein
MAVRRLSRSPRVTSQNVGSGRLFQARGTTASADDLQACLFAFFAEVGAGSRTSACVRAHRVRADFRLVGLWYYGWAAGAPLLHNRITSAEIPERRCATDGPHAR